MGNVLSCYQQSRRSSMKKETTVTSGNEPEASSSSSDVISLPRVSFLPGVRTEKTNPIGLNQWPSNDMANIIIECDKNAFYCPSNLFNNNSNSTVAGLTPMTVRSPLGQQIWRDSRDTYTFTQHEKWLSSSSPTLILPTLYLGSKKDSLKDERLKELQITHILSVMGGNQHLVSGCKQLSVPMADSGNTCLVDVMKRTFDFIKESQQDGNKLLIHCQQGQNRSPTVVIAWLMRESLIKGNPMSMHDAYLFVKAKRNVIHPSNLYIQQLREYDKWLFGVYSVEADFLSVSYVDGQLMVKHEDWTRESSDKYKAKQERERSHSFETHLQTRGVSLDETPRTLLKKKGTKRTSWELPKPFKNEGIANVYQKPSESIEIERFSEDQSVIILREK